MNLPNLPVRPHAPVIKYNVSKKSPYCCVVSYFHFKIKTVKFPQTSRQETIIAILIVSCHCAAAFHSTPSSSVQVSVPL